MRHRRREILDPKRLADVRISLIRRARVVWEGRDDWVMTLDIGLRGVYVEHAAAPPPGTAATVTFTLPENALPLVVGCRVAWRRTTEGAFVRKPLPPGCGLEFTSLDDFGARRLLRHLNEHLSKPGHTRRFVASWPDADEYLAAAAAGKTVAPTS